MDNRYNDNTNRGFTPQGSDDESYTQQYYKQLSEYSAMDNTDYFNSDVDFEFEQYPPQVQQQSYPQRQQRARREYVHPKRKQPHDRPSRPSERPRRQRTNEQRRAPEKAVRRQISQQEHT